MIRTLVNVTAYVTRFFATTCPAEGPFPLVAGLLDINHGQSDVFGR